MTDPTYTYNELKSLFERFRQAETRQSENIRALDQKLDQIAQYAREAATASEALKSDLSSQSGTIESLASKLNQLKSDIDSMKT